MINGAAPQFEVPLDFDPKGNPIYSPETSRLHVQFQRKREINIAATLETGDECFNETLVILKKAPGDTNTAAARATELDKVTYRKEWIAFEAREAGDAQSSIMGLYNIGPAQVQQLVSMGITSIRQAAEAPDVVFAAVHEGPNLKRLAQIWVNARDREKEEREALKSLQSYKDRELEHLAEIEKLQAIIKNQQNPDKPKRPSGSASPGRR